jgi:hypothetical protein
MKGFCSKEKTTDQEILAADINDKIVTFFTITKPLVDFLNKAIKNE